MKKALSLVAAASIIAAASASVAGIVGSKHDLSNTGTATLENRVAGGSTQICIYCHAPHNAAQSLPLWNRDNPVGSLFKLYSGVNMENVSFSSGFSSDSTSLFCMSCHDGTTNMNDVHNAGLIAGATTGTGVHDALGPVSAYRDPRTGELTSGTIGELKNAAIGGKNLTKTHPINFEVTMNAFQSDLYVGSGGSMGNAGHTFPLFKVSDPNRVSAASNRFLECGSCHAVHDQTISPFLRYGMDGSELCLGCHNK